MQTLQFNLVSTQWTEILGGNSALRFQVKTANRVLMHHNDSATPPSLNAPAFLIETFSPRWDYEVDGITAQGRIWVRAENTPSIIVVNRRAAA
jgi:hypothetical protein